MGPLVAAPALVLSLLVLARYAWLTRPRRGHLRITFLDLPLGLAVGFHLDLAPVAARERLRSQFLRTAVFTAVPHDDGRIAFRQGVAASPWFGRLWRPAVPQVFVGSFVAERTAPGGSQLLIRFSTVPVAGWAFSLAAAAGLYLLAQFLAHQRGPWFWLSALALALAVRAFYQTEARRVAWQLLEYLGVDPPRDAPPAS